MALVSILIPVYNRAFFIRRCIQSALAVDGADVEVVVVDNASTDDTHSLCVAFAQQDPRVRVFRNESNLGPVRNWARCAAEARGVYGKLLFSDDLVRADYLKKCLPFLEDPEIGFAFSGTNQHADFGQREFRYRWDRKGGIRSARRFIQDSLFRVGTTPVSPGAALFRLADLRQSLLENIASPTYQDFPDHGAGLDMLVFLLTAARYRNVAYLDEPLVHFGGRAFGDAAGPGAGDEPSLTTSLRNISDRYHQARIWFAARHLGPTAARRLVAQAWLRNCLHQRKMLPYRGFHRRYLFDDGCRLRLPQVLWALWNETRRPGFYVQRMKTAARRLLLRNGGPARCS
jgi:hypothetical protein